MVCISSTVNVKQNNKKDLKGVYWCKKSLVEVMHRKIVFVKVESSVIAFIDLDAISFIVAANATFVCTLAWFDQSKGWYICENQEPVERIFRNVLL